MPTSASTNAIERVLARQGGNGSFGLWGVGGDDLWLDAFVTDFLTRARERQFAVPQIAFNLALDRLRNQVVNTSEINKEEAAGIAYALYVLARNGRPVMGDLRYLADNKLADFAHAAGARPDRRGALGCWAIAAAAAPPSPARWRRCRRRATTGCRGPITARACATAPAVLALIAEANGERADITRAAAIVDSARNAARYTSTQEQMWMVLAAQAMAKDAEGMTLTVDGTERKGAALPHDLRRGAGSQAADHRQSRRGDGPGRDHRLRHPDDAGARPQPGLWRWSG